MSEMFGLIQRRMGRRMRDVRCVEPESLENPKMTPHQMRTGSQ